MSGNDEDEEVNVEADARGDDVRSVESLWLRRQVKGRPIVIMLLPCRTGVPTLQDAQRMPECAWVGFILAKGLARL